jgi:hypothetical protein
LRKPAKPLVPSDPTLVFFDKYDVMAVKAQATGTANPEQQRRFFDLVVYKLSDIRSQSFRRGGVEAARDTDFAEGRKFVGRQVAGLLNMSPSDLDKSGKPNG